MATKTITSLGSQISIITHGVSTSGSCLLADVSGTWTSGMNQAPMLNAIAINLVNSSRARVEVSLYDKNNNIVESKTGNTVGGVNSPQVSLFASGAVAGQQSVFSLHEIRWDVDAATFATGKVSMAVYGKLETSLVLSLMWSNPIAYAFNCVYSGNGVIQLDVPFTVTETA